MGGFALVAWISTDIAKSGVLEHPDDVDFFAISLSGATVYTVTLTGGSSMDVYVYGPNGTTRYGSSSY